MNKKREFDVNPEHNLCLERDGRAKIGLNGAQQLLPMLHVREVDLAYDAAVQGLVSALEYIKNGCPTKSEECTCVRDTAHFALETWKEFKQ